MTEPSVVVTMPVLVVDGDDAVRGLFALALREAGLEVIEADSGPSALAVIDAQGIRVMVSDVGMPAMNGTELVRILRGRPETATMPIILVTGSGEHHSVVTGLEAGADDFLSKPVDLDELVARVRAHLRTQSAWSKVLQEELSVRSGVIAALG